MHTHVKCSPSQGERELSFISPQGAYFLLSMVTDHLCTPQGSVQTQCEIPVSTRGNGHVKNTHASRYSEYRCIPFPDLQADNMDMQTCARNATIKSPLNSFDSEMPPCEKPTKSRALLGPVTKASTLPYHVHTVPVVVVKRGRTHLGSAHLIPRTIWSLGRHYTHRWHLTSAKWLH